MKRRKFAKHDKEWCAPVPDVETALVRMIQSGSFYPSAAWVTASRGPADMHRMNAAWK